MTEIELERQRCIDIIENHLPPAEMSEWEDLTRALTQIIEDIEDDDMDYDPIVPSRGISCLKVWWQTWGGGS